MVSECVCVCVFVCVCEGGSLVGKVVGQIDVHMCMTRCVYGQAYPREDMCVCVNKGRVKLEREKEKRYNSGCICVYMRLCVCVSDYAYDSPMRWEKWGKKMKLVKWEGEGDVRGLCYG